MPLRNEIRQALEGTDNPERALLTWVERQERADWDGCDQVAEAHGFNQDALMKCYADALVWSEQALRFAS